MPPCVRGWQRVAMVSLIMLHAVGCDQSPISTAQREDERIRTLEASWPRYRAPYVPDTMVEAGQDVVDQLRSINRPRVPRIASEADEPINVVTPYYEWDIERTAIDALGRIGEPVVPRLRNLLRSSDPEQRQQAAKMLARIGPAAQDAIPDLIAMLQDPSREVRKAVARALGQMGPIAADAVGPLFQVIEQEQAGGDPQ